MATISLGDLSPENLTQDPWAKNLPPGWQIFADGTAGPRNPASPFDAGWQSRVPPQTAGAPLGSPHTAPGGPAGGAPQPIPGPGEPMPPGVYAPRSAMRPAGPAGPPGPLAAGGAGGGPPMIPGAVPGQPQGPPGPLAEGGPQFSSGMPRNPNPVGAWTNPFTDAVTNGPRVDPAAFGGGGGFNPLGALGGLLGLNPAGRAAIAAAGVMQPTPTAAGDTISPAMAANGVAGYGAHDPMNPGGPAGPMYDPLSSTRTSIGGYGAHDPMNPGVPFVGYQSSKNLVDAPQPPRRPRTPAAAAVAPPAGRQVPNLGYYTGGNTAGGMGGARNPAYQRYTDPNDPRIFKGYLSR
jgi:hypothetical protein